MRCGQLCSGTGEWGAQWRSRLKSQFGERSVLQEIDDEEPAKNTQERPVRWEGIKENGYLRSCERSYFNEEGRVIRFEC